MKNPVYHVILSSHFEKQSQFTAESAVWPQSHMDYLKSLCAFAPSWQKHVQRCTNFYKNSHKFTETNENHVKNSHIGGSLRKKRTQFTPP